MLALTKPYERPGRDAFLIVPQVADLRGRLLKSDLEETYKHFELPGPGSAPEVTQ